MLNIIILSTGWFLFVASLLFVFITENTVAYFLIGFTGIILILLSLSLQVFWM